MCKKRSLLLCDRNHSQSGPKMTKIVLKTTASILRGLFTMSANIYFGHVRKLHHKEPFKNIIGII